MAKITKGVVTVLLCCIFVHPFRYQRLEKVGHLWSWAMPTEKTLLLSYRNKVDDIWWHKVGLLFGACN